MKKQHFEKTITVNDVELKMKKLSPFEFPAFKTVFARATEANDPVGIEQAYEQLATWLLVEIGGQWLPAYDKTNGSFIVEALNDTNATNQIIDLMLTEMIMPLFMSTSE